MRTSKRKRASKTVQRAAKLSVTVEPFFNTDNQIQFHITSATDESKTYKVEYKVYGTGTTKPRLICDCGHQFGRDDRDHCKHIAAVILYQLTQFSFASNDIKKASSPPLTACDETTLINMFKNLGSKAMGTTDYFQPAKFKFSKSTYAKPSASPAPSAAPSLPPMATGTVAAAAMGVFLKKGENPFNLGAPTVLPKAQEADADMVPDSGEPPEDAKTPPSRSSQLTRKLPSFFRRSIRHKKKS